MVAPPRVMIIAKVKKDKVDVTKSLKEKDKEKRDKKDKEKDKEKAEKA